jgi:hypothetical protein
VRIRGGWQPTGLSLPPGGTIRTRGFVAGSGWSDWLVETDLRTHDALQGWDGGLHMSWAASVGWTLGWQFRVNQDIAITALGVHDLGWPNDHQVGLWTDSGTLLASATATTSSPQSGQVRWVNLSSPFRLSAGQRCRIGANYPGPATDIFHYQAVSVTMAPEISYLHSANSGDLGFGFPDGLAAYDCGYFRPNLQFVPAGSALRLSLVRDGSEAILNWTGGQGPYQVQQTTAMDDTGSWENVGDRVQANSMRMPSAPGNVFLRVRGQ